MAVSGASITVICSWWREEWMGTYRWELDHLGVTGEKGEKGEEIIVERVLYQQSWH